MMTSTAAASRKFSPLRSSSSTDKHDIKKSSYYVWFLGAKESKGLRGEEYITPVVRYLLGKEKEQAPIKVTLQLSNKGLKIIQNVSSGKRVHDNYRCGENVKHFIPHHAITCAVRTEEVVSVILLIYNPATSCPVHVHSYRCDSEETAELLHTQLNILIQRPDNQKKFQEIESRLQEKGLLHRNVSNAGSSKLGSDGRSLGRESDSGAGSDKGSQLAGQPGSQQASERIASMYDNLAAELREKLAGKAPLLLPPRDYDTVNRTRGNNMVTSSDNRKSLGGNIVGSIGVMREGAGDSSGNSSGIGSEEDQSPSPEYLAASHDIDNSSDEEWAEIERGPESLMFQPASAAVQDPASSQPLSSRFFQSRSRSGSSPPVKIERFGAKNDRSVSPDNSAKDRFKGAKQLFLSLERKRKESASPLRQKLSSGSQKQNNAQHHPVVERMLSKELADLDLRKEEQETHVDGVARWSQYEQEQADNRWPKSDRDTGYVSRYSRDKSGSRDFDESPPSSARPNIFVKSGKKSSPDSKLQSKRLSRFLSRETLESDGYDHIEEFEPEPVDNQRNKVKRQLSRSSMKMDMRRSSSRDPVRDDTDILAGPPEPRRGFIRREMTDLDLKGYMQAKGDGFSKKYTPSPWSPPGMVRERALSPGRPKYHDHGHDDPRFQSTKILMPEFRGGHPPDNRYPSLDMRNEKRKSMYEGAGDVLARRQELARRHYPEHHNDYRRRSYHELSDVDKIDHSAPRNFQHSGRKMCPDPIGLPARGPMPPRGQPGYRIIPSEQRYPGLDRENSRHGAFKNTIYHPNNVPTRGPRSFDHPANRPAMFRHSYAEPSPMHQHFPPGPPGRFGLASLKPY